MHICIKRYIWRLLTANTLKTLMVILLSSYLLPKINNHCILIIFKNGCEESQTWAVEQLFAKNPTVCTFVLGGHVPENCSTQPGISARVCAA